MTSSGPSTYWISQLAAPMRTLPRRGVTTEASPEQVIKDVQQKPTPTHSSEPNKGKAIAELDRAANYLNAVRELKEVPAHPKHLGAHEVYLNVAHYEQQPGLIDLYV